MKIDKAGIDFIKKHEGCRLYAYKCFEHEVYYTIGYGHYGVDVSPNQKITQEQAENLLIKDLERFEKGVNDYVKVKITQSMYNALVSFCYNLGNSRLKNSTLLQKLNAGDYIGASEEFKKWRCSGGKVIAGLERRREEERKEFLRLGIPNKEAEKETSELSENIVDISILPNLSKYKGDSIVDGLKSVGYDSSMKSRRALWKQVGKTDKYKGTAEQNKILLNYLRGKNFTVGKIPSLKGYKGFSLVDGLKQFGYNSSFSSRGYLWSMIGKKSKYKGTSKQNTILLDYLKTV